MHLRQALVWVTSVLPLFTIVSADSRDFNYYPRMQAERRDALIQAQLQAATGAAKSDYRYYNAKTKPYFIESLPDVNFDIGEFYSGSVPIDESNPNRTLFFVFKPAQNGPSKNLTIWLNGGPGCSSLVGFFQENGPILWQPGVFAPKSNPYAWSQLTNMLWVEQPVGTGFAQGKVTATNEVDVAKEFIGFFANFEKLFGIKDYKIFVTGESYAGRYVPYISAGMLDQKNTTYFDLSGAITYDPCIGSFDVVGQEIPAYPFARANSAIIGLNDTFLDSLEAKYKSCGYADYMDKYLTFPPPGHQPVEKKTKCALFYDYLAAAYEVNDCFDVYHITNYCPTISDPVGGPWRPLEKTAYFNRTDVKKAIHAPLDVSWSECSEISVFADKDGGPEHEGDKSPDPIQGVLPQVIEATNRVLVGNGDWDGLLLTNGTLLSIQNMTWHGKLGLQTPPPYAPLVVPTGNEVNDFLRHKPQGTVGTWHYERGLMWVTTSQSGHMQPEFQPRATLRHLEWLLGIIDTL